MWKKAEALDLYLKLERAEGADQLPPYCFAGDIHTHCIADQRGRKARIDLKRCYFLNEFSCV